MWTLLVYGASVFFFNGLSRVHWCVTIEYFLSNIRTEQYYTLLIYLLSFDMISNIKPNFPKKVTLLFIFSHLRRHFIIICM